MPRLKSKQRQIPNGYRFLQPETGYRSTPFASFQSIVDGLISHRRGRPDLVAKHNWATDQDNVANEVEQFNVRLCLQHGWNEYLDSGDVGGGMPPKSSSPSQQEVSQISAAADKAKKIWAGVRTLNEWIDSGEPPVSQELAESRAATCVVCPHNAEGGFEKWFTKPAAGAIQKQIERLGERKLATSHDEKLNICDICLCPNKLKVWTPLKYIKGHLAGNVLAEFKTVPGCWIAAEVGK